MEQQGRDGGGVEMRFGADEALVLFEWLSRNFDDRQGAALAASLVRQAEQRVLWDLQASLGSALVASFAADYGEELAAARERSATRPSRRKADRGRRLRPGNRRPGRHRPRARPAHVPRLVV